MPKTRWKGPKERIADSKRGVKMGLALFGAPLLHHLFKKISLKALKGPAYFPLCQAAQCGPAGRAHESRALCSIRTRGRCWPPLSHVRCGEWRYGTPPRLQLPLTYATRTHTCIHTYIYTYHSSSSLPTPPMSTPSLGPAQGLGPAASQLCTSGAAQ